MSTLPPLEELLLAACERGINHLTLYPVPSADGKTIYWSARGTPSTMHKYVEVNDVDPIVALRGVLLGLPKAPKRPAKTRGARTPIEPEITAAVKHSPAYTASDEQWARDTGVIKGEEPPPAADSLDSWLPKV